MTSTRVLAGASVALALLAGVSLTHAQPTVLWEVSGSASYEKLGRSVAGAGDLNDDGYADFIVGIPSGGPVGGRVEVYSGFDGKILHTFNGTVGAGNFGLSVANAGDVNDDGVPDILVGAPSYYPGASAQPGHVQVFSGSDGSVLHTIHDVSSNNLFGHSVAGVGDVNGDGHSDFLVGAPGPGGIGGGFAKLCSGADGSVLSTVFGMPRSNLGRAVAGLGDVDGDGVPDFALGAPGYDAKKQSVGQVTVYSGATLMILKTLTGKKESLNLGYTVAGAGDVNGDGLGDLIIGAIGGAPGKKMAAGQVFVYSGKKGKKLLTINGQTAGGFLGTAVAGAGDVDGDGLAEVAIGAEGINTFGGMIVVLGKSKGKTKIHFLLTGAPGEVFGDSVANAGDVKNDGVPDLIMGGWGADLTGMPDAGVARVYSY